jgi:addiction module HigA family antidote
MSRQVKYPHPGEILKEEFLEPMGISMYRLAKEIEVPQQRIGQIISGERSITAETALLLSRFFGTSDGFWLNLQASFDIATEKDRLAIRLNTIKPYASAVRETAHA